MSVIKVPQLKNNALQVSQFSSSRGIALIVNINHKIHTTKMLNLHHNRVEDFVVLLTHKKME